MATAYKDKKERERARNAANSRSERDIAPLPAVAEPARKSACERDFRLFCESYFPLTFDLAWSDDHLKVIAQIKESVLSGGLFATAMPRGSGKTSLAEQACIWAILYGHREFVALIGSDEGLASDMLDSVKTELESNDLLLDDFPEAVYPIRRLEGIAHRCNGQLFEGERTHVGWTAGEVVMPTLPGSKSSGAVLKVAGITGGIRGMKHKRADGRTVRPSLVVIDDPQTDGSARSPSQCATRERILAGAILGLAGPGKKISAIMPCTVIAPGDMADTILDRQKHPAWNGTRTKMVYAFPAAEKLWEEYKRLRGDGMREGDAGRSATEFYGANREAMDAGAVVAWPARYRPDELSAVQHAMNLLIDNPEAFHAEYQNEPLPAEDPRGDDLTPDQVASKLNRLPRGLVPTACNRVTSFIDVQGSLLYWVACAWEDDFTGYVLDYNTFPDQKRAYFTLRDAKRTLETAVKGAGLEGQIYGGLEALCADILGRDWARDDGANLKVDRCLVDANWGVSTPVVKKFCRQSAHAAVLTPSHGKGIGAAYTPMDQWPHKPGEKAGPNWRVRSMEDSRGVRSVIYDANGWKSFVHARLSTAMGDRGCLSLFGDKAETHRLFADHVCAEYRVRTEGRGRKVDEWKLRPERPDNHWWDGLCASAVAASMQGVALAESTSPPARAKKVSFADLQRQRRA